MIRKSGYRFSEKIMLKQKIAQPTARVLMTIKAVVFDAYGTLYDIQSVVAVT